MLGCKPDMKVHQMFYGTTSPSVTSITVGMVETIKPTSKGMIQSPSVISPDQIAFVRTIETVKGEKGEDWMGLAFESQRANAPVVKQKYVFFWDQAGKCIRYCSVKGDFYVQDGQEVPLGKLKEH